MILQNFSMFQRSLPAPLSTNFRQGKLYERVTESINTGYRVKSMNQCTVFSLTITTL